MILLSELYEDSELKSYLTWDSLAAVSTIAIIDKNFNIPLKGCEIDKCKTLKCIFTLVETKKLAA